MGFMSKYYNRLKNGEEIEDIIADVRSDAVPDKPKRSQPEKPKQPEPQQSEQQEPSLDESSEANGNHALDVDWEERHFRICLAMISNSSVTKSLGNWSRAGIINHADRMIAELKRHYSQKSPNLPIEDKE